ncbi:MAG: ComEC/Rec2 family competence protein [Bacteroidetes bacterium]|nr:ComEC/Rec2 family competence protein [Bacteroidota bacterium]
MLPYAPKAFKKYPFFRLLCPLILGILWQWYLPAHISVIYGAIIIVVCLYILSGSLGYFTKYALRWLSGLYFNLFFLLVGTFITYHANPKHQPFYFEKSYTQGDLYSFTLLEPLVEKDKTYSAMAEIEGIFKKGHWQNATGKIRVYFFKNDFSDDLHYGTRLFSRQNILQIKNSGNPHSFDYKSYALFHGFAGQVFLKRGDYILVSQGKVSFIQKALFQCRASTIRIIKKNIPGPGQQGVAEALLIGYRDDLDKSLVQAYSNTGVVHIIAISGLHLGMIFVLISSILSGFKKVKGYRFFRPVIILLILWGFTFLAGAVPSVLRSAVMFSFLVIGEAWERKTNTLNTLAAAAFFLLLINPFMLWDVGFQLSFAAVAGIVSFLWPINNWLYFENKIIIKIWLLISITISAQIFTLPLVLYYFHQFPVFFLISNLVVVPLSGIILYGELLLVCFSFSGIASKYIGKVLDFLLSYMNHFIMHMDNLPFARVTGIQLNIFETMLMFLMIGGALFFLLYKKKAGLWFAFMATIIFSIFISFEKVSYNFHHLLIVYNVPGNSAIDIIAGREAYFWGDSLVVNNPDKMRYNISPVRNFYRIKNENQLLKTAHIEINKKEIFFVGEYLPDKKDTGKINADILIISRNPMYEVNDLNQVYQYRLLVLDSSVPLWKTEKWKRDCDSLHLRFHSVSASGAFVMGL